MNPIIFVMGYGGGQKVFDRHIPLWLAHGWPVHVLTSSDNPVRTSLPIIIAGKQGPIGINHYHFVLESFRRFLRFSEHDISIWFEYDSFCTIPNPTLQHGFHANVETNVEGGRFRSPTYPLYPMVMDRKSVSEILATAMKHPEVIEEGYADRLLGALSGLCGVEFKPFSPPGFCRNTILKEDYPELIKTLRAGGQWIHGIKDNETLGLIQNTVRSN